MSEIKRTFETPDWLRTLVLRESEERAEGLHLMLRRADGGRLTNAEIAETAKMFEGAEEGEPS